MSTHNQMRITGLPTGAAREKAKGITREKIAESFDYCHETGIFTWKKGKMTGSKAGVICHRGYIKIYMDGCGFQAHRLAWIMITGSSANMMIDHIDGNRANNAASNLREAEPWQNRANSRVTKLSATGVKNVSPDRGGWRVEIGFKGGRYSRWCKQKAEAERDAAMMRPILHGKFASSRNNSITGGNDE